MKIIFRSSASGASSVEHPDPEGLLRKLFSEEIHKLESEDGAVYRANPDLQERR
jgi:hypothetical protein